MADRAPMSADEVSAFLDRAFPEIHAHGRLYRIEAAGSLSARVTLDFHPSQIRPGGTISGPTMMALADLALYVAILAEIGPVGLAVTTNLAFNFLRKPGQTGLACDCRLLKLGKRLAVGEASIFNRGEDALVCHATGTYSIPDR